MISNVWLAENLLRRVPLAVLLFALKFRAQLNWVSELVLIFHIRVMRLFLLRPSGLLSPFQKREDRARVPSPSFWALALAGRQRLDPARVRSSSFWVSKSLLVLGVKIMRLSPLHFVGSLSPCRA